MNYTFGGKQRALSFGAYLLVRLADARQMRRLALVSCKEARSEDSDHGYRQARNADVEIGHDGTIYNAQSHAFAGLEQGVQFSALVWPVIR